MRDVWLVPDIGKSRAPDLYHSLIPCAKHSAAVHVIQVQRMKYQYLFAYTDLG